MATEQGRYTVQEAAKALGVSVRTIRRRLSEGALSASHVTKGEREVLVIDGAELARYAQAVGLGMAIREGPGGQAGAPRAREDTTEGREMAPAISRFIAYEGRTGGMEGQLEAPRAEESTTEGRDVAELWGQVRALTEERDFLRRVLENTTRALPEARDSGVDATVAELREVIAGQANALERLKNELRAARAPWWRQLFRGKTGDDDG